eukprot:scaffold310_cov307-Pinguiococcus_pyrenoidosus.AAC.13
MVSGIRTLSNEGTAMPCDVLLLATDLPSRLLRLLRKRGLLLSRSLGLLLHRLQHFGNLCLVVDLDHARLQLVRRREASVLLRPCLGEQSDGSRMLQPRQLAGLCNLEQIGVDSLDDIGILR